MTKTTPNRESAVLTAFSVTVVDGSGVELCGEPVTATYHVDGGRRHTVTCLTGVDGEAHFVQGIAGDPLTVTVASCGESVGPIRPTPGARLVIEA